MSEYPTSEWRLPTDEDEIADLASVGLMLDDPIAADQPRRDAFASWLLESMARADLEIAERERARDMEIAIINARYERSLARLRIRRLEKESQVKVLAEISALSGGFGKQKSRTVGYGSYGGRKKPERLEVTDAAEVLNWARGSNPALIRVTTREDVPVAPLAEYFKASGEDIPGTRIAPESTEWFAKPESTIQSIAPARGAEAA